MAVRRRGTQAAGRRRVEASPPLSAVLAKVNHIAYWAADVLEQLEGRGRLRPQAWPPGEGGPDEWRRAVGSAGRLHGRLVRRIDAHISYHAGRMALLKRLRRAAAV